MASRQLLIDAAIALAMVLVALVGYKLSPLFLPQADTVASPVTGCDLQRGPCTASLPDGRRLELSVTPRPIPMVRPLNLEVKLEGIAADKVEVDFAGATMNMGYNRRTLTAAGAGRYVGTATLPVCITGAMTWRATVLAQAGRERVAAAFDFDSASAHP
ncbi:MAG TPA: hypothetical protein VMB75_02160 [Rhodocyclaceae bacterium]|nr:hypothetical protein [Rhodocyclaceae bacterium]